ncbi:MAG: GTP 3',8-cyclase MoaA [Gammaproteobacteria bacterium]|nr:MAG: GTP 3',8-cyclase MoaA [Gammaproteobacteria bacterium]
MNAVHPDFPLIDPFKRRLSYLRLSVTDRCNFRCTYCLPNGYQGRGHTDELTIEEIGNLVSIFARLGTQKIRLTGGEPTLRKDIGDIIRVCNQPDTIKKVAMTTNGWNLQRHYKQWITAGLNQINVSIDSLDGDTFKAITGKRSLRSILRAMDQLLTEEKISLKINAVLLRSYEKQQLREALAFVKKKPVTFRFIELMQTGENNALFKQAHLTGAEVVDYLLREGWQPLPRKLDAGPAVEYTHPDYAGRMGVIAPYSKDFCKTCNRLRITAVGNLHLCLFDSQAFNIRPYLAAGKQQQLADYLRHLMIKKPESHYLKNDYVGLIKNLAMIGG